MSFRKKYPRGAENTVRVECVPPEQINFLSDDTNAHILGVNLGDGRVWGGLSITADSIGRQTVRSKQGEKLAARAAVDLQSYLASYQDSYYLKMQSVYNFPARILFARPQELIVPLFMMLHLFFIEDVSINRLPHWRLVHVILFTLASGFIPVQFFSY